MVDDSAATLKAAAAGSWISAILLIVILAGLLLGWFSSGGGLAGGFSGFFSSIGSFFMRFFGGAKGGLSALGDSIKSLLVAVILFIPDTAFLGGFIADAVNAQFRYSVPSIAGIVSALVNRLVSLYTEKNVPRSTEYIVGSPWTNPSPQAQAPASSTGTGGILAGLMGAASPAAAAATAAATATAAPGAPPSARRSTSIGYGVGTAVTSAAAAPAALLAEAAAPAPATAPATAPARSVGPPVSIASRPGAAGHPDDMSSIGGIGGKRKQTGGSKFTGSHSSILGIPLGTKSQPAGLAILATIVMIYTLDAASGKRHGAALAVQVCVGIFTLIAYWISYYYTEAYGNMKLSAIPVLIGLSVGGACYYYFPKYHPLDPEASPMTPSGEQSKCSGGKSTGEFVCDAYLNGVRIGTIPT